MDVQERVEQYREQLREDREELASCQEKVLHLLNAVCQEFPERRVAFVEGGSVLNSLFGEEPPQDFFPLQNDDERRKRLAQERRAEYNAFLQKKEEEFLRRRTMSPKVTPRSILESVDYEKVLAKRKAEESHFRNLNRAEPSMDKNVSIPVQNHSKYPKEEVERNFNRAEPSLYKNVSIPVQNNSKYSKEEVERNLNIAEPSLYKNFSIPVQNYSNYPKEEVESIQRIPSEPKYVPVLNSSFKGEDAIDYGTNDYLDKRPPQPLIGFMMGERRGGGGDPLRDSDGNLITSRSSVSFPSQQQNLSKNKQLSYREELKRQIEEKRALEAEERRLRREHDDLIARRIEEQRLQMQKEYEEEQMRTQRKSEQRDRERLERLEAFQLKDAADRRKRAPPPPEPIVEPTMPKDEGRRSPPIPTVRSKVILESVSAQTMPTEVKPENVFSSLSEIRRTLMQEQLQSKKDLKNSYEVTNRRTVPDVLEDEDDDFK